MKKNKKNRKGFSLLELLVAIFIFSVAMLAASIIFANTFKAYSNSSNIQNNLENAQFGLNSMAKIIRQGKIESSAGKVKSILIYDSTRKVCTGYRLVNNALETGVCAGHCTCSIPYNIAVDNVDFSLSDFRVIQTSNTHVGLVTIIIRLCSDSACAKPDKMTLQTSVSSRNYFDK